MLHKKAARPEGCAAVIIRLIQPNELSVKVACVDTDAIDADRAGAVKVHHKVAPAVFRFYLNATAARLVV